MGFITKAKGKKPKLPGTYPTVDIFAETQQAFKDIASQYPDVSELGRLSVDEMNKRLEQLLPGATALKGSVTENIQSLVKGELPQDVQDFIKRQSAEFSVGQGTSGSEFARNRTLRDLGLTSLQATQAGLDAASRWLAQASAQVPDFSAMFITPAQRVAIKSQENANQFQLDVARAKIRAAPEPWAAALTDFLDSIASTWTGAGIGSVTGGGGGGGQKYGPYGGGNDPFGGVKTNAGFGQDYYTGTASSLLG